MDNENKTPQDKVHHPAAFTRNAEGKASLRQDLSLLDFSRTGGQICIPGF